MSKNHNRKQINKKAIVLAHFGTTVPGALNSLDVTKNAIKESFPGVELAVSFTSNIIRDIWTKRRAKEQYWLDQGVSKEILNTRSILGTIGDLQNRGYRSIIVQPTHIAHGEQYEDLKSYINGLQMIRTTKKRWMPFEKIVCSRPVLGTHGIEFGYQEDIKEVITTLACDAEHARREKADLIYIGHGNEYFSTGAYLEAQREMNRQNPDINTIIGLVEGFPEMDDVLVEIQEKCKKNILLKPFMLTAGEHSHKDMAGDDDQSWKSRLRGLGFNIITVLEGLGSNKAFSEIFAKRIQQTADYHNIDLSKG
ncbi:MAG: sirohydrochlorin cobaltochelatase [Proteobacteria bacterium]|nr:sirohydrochlorin cobaltochelatase [Pseudomonadota bacterium]